MGYRDVFHYLNGYRKESLEEFLIDSFGYSQEDMEAFESKAHLVNFIIASKATEAVIGYLEPYYLEGKEHV